MRIAVAGSGSIGRRHIVNLHQLLPSLQIVLIRMPVYQDALSLSLNACTVETIDEAIKLDIDGLIVATPSSEHADLVSHSLRAGIPTYIEKPVVATLSQFELLSTQLSTLEVAPPTLVGCNLRYLPSLRLAQKLVADGALGNIARATFECAQWLPDWRPSINYKHSYSASPSLGGGVLLDLIHEFDSAFWFLGRQTLLSSHTTRNSSLEIDTEHAAVSVLRSDQQTLITIGLDYVSRTPYRRYHLIGDNSSLLWDLSSKQLYLQEKNGKTTMLTCDPSDFDVSQTYLEAMRHFIDLIRHKRQSQHPLEEGLIVTKSALEAKALSGS